MCYIIPFYNFVRPHLLFGASSEGTPIILYSYDSDISRSSCCIQSAFCKLSCFSGVPGYEGSNGDFSSTCRKNTKFMILWQKKTSIVHKLAK